jgi:hypothetical protein
MVGKHWLGRSIYASRTLSSSLSVGMTLRIAFRSIEPNRNGRLRVRTSGDRKVDGWGGCRVDDDACSFVTRPPFPFLDTVADFYSPSLYLVKAVEV